VLHYLKPSSSAPGTDHVVWSGGLDSTLILGELASSSSGRPVHAIVIDRHPQLQADMLEAQRVAQRAFVSLAKKRGWVFKVTRLSIGVAGPGMVSGENPQATLWLHLASLYVSEGDTLHFGFIRGDDFWHTRGGFEAAFRTMCTYKGVSAALSYPLEWSRKADVVYRIRSLKIPPRCVSTCESPLRGRGGKLGPCGQCLKCEDLARALAATPNPFEKLTVLKRRPAEGRSLKDPHRPKPVTFRW